MAVISPAIGIQDGSHSAQAFRQLVSALAGQDVETFAGGVSASGPAHGLVRSGHLAVSEKSGTPDMSVDVASGLALITGTSSLAQGPYAFCNDATVNLAIATADSTNDRHDLIVAQVRDNDEDGGGQNDARLAVVTGTPAGSPSDPAVPAGCLVLARVVVGANASSIINADITRLASVARGSNWNQAWGTVAFAQSTSDQNGVSTQVDVTGLSLTFAADPDRMYRTTLYLPRLSQQTGAGQVSAAITDGSDTQVQGAVTGLAGAGPLHMNLTAVESGLSGSITRKGRFGTSANTVNLDIDSFRPAFILIEDIGPA